MKRIFIDVDPTTFTGSAFIVGLLLVGDLLPSEQDSIGNWLQLVGLVMQTYASQVTTLESNSNDNQDNTQNNTQNNTCDIDSLKKAIDKIRMELDNIKNNK